MYCATNQSTELQFLGPYNKPHGICGLVKHDHMRFDPKILHCTFAIRHIPCVCTSYTSILDQPWVKSLSAQQQPFYQPFQYCTFWPVLGSFTNLNILKFSHKATSSEEIEARHQVLLEVISENVDALVQTDKYSTISTTYTATMG